MLVTYSLPFATKYDLLCILSKEAAQYLHEQISGGICTLFTGFHNWFVQSVFGKFRLAIIVCFRSGLLPNLAGKMK